MCVLLVAEVTLSTPHCTMPTLQVGDAMKALSSGKGSTTVAAMLAATLGDALADKTTRKSALKAVSATLGVARRAALDQFRKDALTWAALRQEEGASGAGGGAGAAAAAAAAAAGSSDDAGSKDDALRQHMEVMLAQQVAEAH